MLRLKLKLQYSGHLLTHWKSHWCWERLRAEGEEGVRAWDGWMASPMQWAWTWASSRRLLRFMSTEPVMLSNNYIICWPLLLLTSILPSTRIFSNDSALCNKWPKYWSFSISPSNEYSGLISFKIDWFDHLAVQGTLKSLLQLYNSKSSILWYSAFLMIQLSYPYMTTGKIIALTIWTFVSKVMSWLFICCLDLS